MSRETGRRRIYRSRVVRRRRSALAVFVAVALAAIVVVAAQGGGRERVRVTYDRRAAVAYADAWALKVNPEYWSSPDNDCANFVSQCLAAGGLRPTYDDGREWRSNGTEFPTVAWVNCGAQKRALSAARRRALTLHRAQSRGRCRQGGRPGDIVYLGNVVDGELEWQHVMICAGREGGEWVYDSHTAAYRRATLDHWYPAHFTEVRYCRIADVVSYAARAREAQACGRRPGSHGSTRRARHPAGHAGLGAAEVPAADLVEHVEDLLAAHGELGGVVVAQGDGRVAVAGDLEVRVGHPARAARLVGAPDVVLPDLVVVADADRVAGAEAHRVGVAGHVRLDDADALRQLRLGHGPSTMSSTHDSGTQPSTPAALRQRR